MVSIRFIVTNMKSLYRNAFRGVFPFSRLSSAVTGSSISQPHHLQQQPRRWISQQNRQTNHSTVLPPHPVAQHPASIPVQFRPHQRRAADDDDRQDYDGGGDYCKAHLSILSKFSG